MPLNGSLGDLEPPDTVNLSLRGISCVVYTHLHQISWGMMPSSRSPGRIPDLWDETLLGWVLGICIINKYTSLPPNPHSQVNPMRVLWPNTF